MPVEILEINARKNWTSIMRCFEHKNAYGGGGSVSPSVFMLQFDVIQFLFFSILLPSSGSDNKQSNNWQEARSK